MSPYNFRVETIGKGEVDHSGKLSSVFYSVLSLVGGIASLQEENEKDFPFGFKIRFRLLN